MRPRLCVLKERRVFGWDSPIFRWNGRGEGRCQTSLKLRAFPGIRPRYRLYIGTVPGRGLDDASLLNTLLHRSREIPPISRCVQNLIIRYLPSVADVSGRTASTRFLSLEGGNQIWERDDIENAPEIVSQCGQAELGANLLQSAHQKRPLVHPLLDRAERCSWSRGVGRGCRLLRYSGLHAVQSLHPPGHADRAPLRRQINPRDDLHVKHSLRGAGKGLAGHNCTETGQETPLLTRF